MKSLVSSVVAVLLAGAVLVGCSGEKSSDATTTTSTAKPAEQTIKAPFSTVDEAINYENPVVLAHAGGENTHPHSTMFAYAESVKAGVDILDFDVRLTKDGVLVIFHDDTVDRTTNSTGRVDDMTWDELHALDASYWFTRECSACKDQPEDAYIYRGIRTGAKNPPKGYKSSDFAPTRFEDVVERFPDFVLNIEIKGSFPSSVPVAKELARILKKHNKLDAAVVTAFDDKLAEAFHEIEPTVAITPGLQAMTSYVLADQKLPAERRIVQIPPEYQDIALLTPDFIARAPSDGLVLWIWPNERDWENSQGYRKLLDLGVDGLNAANPEEAVETVKEFVKGS